jgi:ubiquinone/menaquinone biosynthesis C-methylase UbiE
MAPMRLPLEYGKLSGYYDTPDGSANANSTNRSIEKILKRYGIKTVLDLTCGTGSQVFWLAKRGYDVTGADFSPSLLKIAKSRAKKEKTNVRLLKGDMRAIKVGNFDAVITIFNAVGHLTKKDFEKAMRNINRNLKDGGLYVFDIDNSDCTKNNTMKMDITKTFGKVKFRKIQLCKLNRKNKVLLCRDCFSVQKGSGKPKIFKGKFALQLYTAKELREMLTRNGFEVLGQYGIDGSKFSEKKTKSILTIAKKQ